MRNKEKNNYEADMQENASHKRKPGENEKEDKYVDENFNTTDSDAAEINPPIKQASQESGNTIEEGDEDYDDEEK